MPKSAPINIRLSSDLEKRINALARRTGRSRNALLESLIDEAERERRYPGLRFRGTDSTRRPYIIGTGMDVWEIVRALQDFADDAARLANETKLATQDIGLALAYYREFPEEIDQALAMDRRPLEELQRDYPFIETLLID